MSCIPCSVTDHLLWHCLPPNPHLQNTMQMSSSSFPHHPIPWSQPAILPSKFSLETYKSICPWKQTGREVGRLSLDFYFPFSPPNPIPLSQPQFCGRLPAVASPTLPPFPAVYFLSPVGPIWSFPLEHLYPKVPRNSLYRTPMATLARSQKHSLPSNPQSPHSLKNQRWQQKRRNGTQ